MGPGMVSHGARKVSHDAGKVSHGAGKVSHGARKWSTVQTAVVGVLCICLLRHLSD